MRKYILIGPVILIIIWFIVSNFSLIDPLLLPSPENVIKKLLYLFSTGIILPDLIWTLIRWICGLCIGIILGIPIGLLMGVSRRVYASLEGLVDFFRSIPVMAMFPIFLMFLGIGDQSKIAISAWTTMLYVVINTLYGVLHGNESHRMVARVFRANPLQTFTKVVFMDAIPHIFIGMRISVSMSLVLVIAAEMVMGTTVGLGKRIFESSLTFSVSEMYATILIVGILGLLSNKLFVQLERHFIHWK